MNTKPEFYFDENLRDVPVDPDGLRLYVSKLQTSLDSTLDVRKRVSLLGEIGVYLRSLNELDKSQSVLEIALEEVNQHHLGIRVEVQQKIRLAHTLQWKKDFKKSTALFDEILNICRSNPDAEFYLDFALQHAGKNYFDQNLYQAAKVAFLEALHLRKQRKAPQDQLESTELALKTVLSRIGKD